MSKPAYASKLDRLDFVRSHGIEWSDFQLDVNIVFGQTLVVEVKFSTSPDDSDFDMAKLKQIREIYRKDFLSEFDVARRGLRIYSRKN